MERVTLDVVPVKEMPVLDGTRRIRVDIDPWEGLRTHDGRRLSTEWGEPDAEGFYTPTITVHNDDRLGELDEAWERAEAAATALGLTVAQAYREELGCQPDGTCPYGQWWAYASRDRHDDDPVIGKGHPLTAALLDLAERLEALR